MKLIIQDPRMGQVTLDMPDDKAFDETAQQISTALSSASHVQIPVADGIMYIPHGILNASLITLVKDEADVS